MAIGFKRLRQIAKPDDFTDSLSGLEVSGIEASATDLSDFFTGLLSQFKRLIHGNDPGNWSDDPASVFGSDASLKALYYGAIGGGIGGTIADNQVAIGAGANIVEGFDSLTVYEPASPPNMHALSIGEVGSEYYTTILGGATKAAMEFSNSVGSTLLSIGNISSIGNEIKTHGQNLSIKGNSTERVLVNNVDLITSGSGNLALLDDGTYGSVGGGGTGGSGWVYIADADVQVSGTISNKVYQDAGNTVLQSFTTSTVDITLSIRSSYPKITVDGNPFELTRDVGGGYYEGDTDITIAASGDISVVIKTADDENGASDTVAITLAAPPELLTLSFTGGYPGSQTELKEDDNYGITGTTDKVIDAIEVYDYEAGQYELITGLSGTSFSEAITVADRGDSAVLRPARVRARDAVTGAWGPTRDTDFGGGSTEGVHVVNCNNLHPSVSIGSVTYPGAQGALKGSESASVANTCSDFDTILYSDPTSTQLNIANTTTYEASKSVTRIGGDYNVSTTNFRITANRAANDATTIANDTVNIANVAAQITVAEPAARLRSGGNDGTSIQNHTITLTSNQQLLSTPSLSEDTGGGTFVGSWSGGPTVYTRTLQVHDDDVKATYNWQSLSATNLAGIVTTTITGDDSYVLGGFVARTLTFAAFSQSVSLNSQVITYTKLQAGIFTSTNQPAVRHTPQGDQGDAANEYTILSPLGTNPQTLWWNDVAAAGANSGGTAQITNVEEIV